MYIFNRNVMVMMMKMITLIHKRNTLQIMATNKKRSPNLGMPV